MEHSEAQSLVSDWGRGRLDATQAREVEAHVRICHACQQVAGVSAGLDAEGSRLAAVHRQHPSSDTLARYVTGAADESITTLAAIGSHVRSCETCREDVALMRGAATPAWWRGVRSWFDSPGAPAHMLQPALAVAAVLLVVPAWLGIVELPREREAAERLRADAVARSTEAAARTSLAQPSLPSGGGAAALVLRGATRGAEALPEVMLRAGQQLQPVLIDAALPAGAIAFTLVREPNTEVWSHAGPREEFWDPANALAGLLIPTASLASAGYRLELRSGDAEVPFLTARFRVVAAR